MEILFSSPSLLSSSSSSRRCSILINSVVVALLLQLLCILCCHEHRVTAVAVESSSSSLWESSALLESTLEPAELYVMVGGVGAGAGGGGADGDALGIQSMDSLRSGVSTATVTAATNGELSVLVLQVVDGEEEGGGSLWRRWFRRSSRHRRPAHIRSRFVLDRVLDVDSPPTTVTLDAGATTDTTTTTSTTTTPMTVWLHERDAVRGGGAQQLRDLLLRSSRGGSASGGGDNGDDRANDSDDRDNDHSANAVVYQFPAAVANRVFAELGSRARIAAVDDGDDGDGRRRRLLVVYAMNLRVPQVDVDVEKDYHVGDRRNGGHGAAPTTALLGHVEWEVRRGRGRDGGRRRWWWPFRLPGGLGFGRRDRSSYYRSGSIVVVMNARGGHDTHGRRGTTAETWDPEYTERALLSAAAPTTTTTTTTNQGTLIQGFYYSPGLRKKLLGSDEKAEEDGDDDEEEQAAPTTTTTATNQGSLIQGFYYSPGLRSKLLGSGKTEEQEQLEQQELEQPEEVEEEQQQRQPAQGTISSQLYMQCQRRWTSACERWFIAAVEKTL